MRSRWSPTAGTARRTALELLPIEWDFGDSAETSTEGYYAEGHKLMEQKGPDQRQGRPAGGR
jgi:hypothetical protein